MKSLFSSRRSPQQQMAATSDSAHHFRLKEIICLLQEKSESLASCRSRLSLTQREIKEICSSLYSSFHSNNESSSSSLITLLGNVKAVRILPEPPSNVPPLCETINLSPFHRLIHLELRNVPITRVIHLSQLRSQLSHLVLYASADSLDEVLQECGGDKCTDSFLWSELHSLHVTNCQSIDLGSGLQLAPWLKTLDLTFNGLTDNAMQSLSTLLTLHSLILNFNSLQRIPILAPSARTSLKILQLRQNQLDSLNGVEQLHSLEELDVAYNCISNGEGLAPLSFLTHLVKLNLEYNPVSYVKDYRLVVLRRVSSSINRKKFQLDCKPLSPHDKENVGMMATLYCGQPELSETWSSSRLQPQPAVVISVADNQVVSQSIPNAVTPSAPATNDNQLSLLNGSVRLSSDSLTPVTPSSFSALKRRKATRMREVEIVEYSDPAPPATPFHPSEEKLVSSVALQPATDPGHLTTKQRVEELRRTFGQENWLTSQAGNEVRLLLGWQETATQPVESAGAIHEIVDTKSETSDTTNSTKDDAILVLESKNQSSPVDQRSQQELVREDEEESDELHVFVVQRQLNSESQEERLLTVSAAFLYEKDALSGQTLFCWKRSNLQSVTMMQLLECSSRPIVKVQLTFHHGSIRNNGSNEVIYVMEQDDFNELEKVMPSETASTESSRETEKENSKVMDDMSCMKCDRKFSSMRAAVRLRTAISSPLLKGHLEEYSVCPYCASDMVFAVDQQQKIVFPRRADASAISGSESASSSSNQSGSDVIVASNDPYSPERGGDISDTSEEGSVEVMDKTAHLLDSVEYSTPCNANGSHFARDLGPKSISSRSHSSKSSSQTSRANSLARPSPSVRSLTSAPPFSYSYADFSQVDHRLRLYCEMFVLSHQTEEFHGLVKADVVTMNACPVDKELTPSPSLLIVTSHKVYFLRITATASCEPPEKWLNLESSFPLNQLVNVLTAIGNQGVVLQFSNYPPHLILLRDQRRTKNMTHFLTDVLEKSGLTVPLVRTDLMTDQWSALDSLVRGDQDTNSISSMEGEPARRHLSDSSSRVFLFCLTCHMEWGNGQQKHTATYDNTALMVTSDRMALVRGDPRWLTSHQVQFRTWGVSLLSLQQLVNLVSLESFVSKPEQIRCYFLDEASGMEEKWTVTLATREAVDQLIEAVRYPWEAVFSVELEINELDE